jgi:hypothetical protein
MAPQGKPDELVTLQELAVSNAYEIAALVALLERKGILTQQEEVDEIKRLKAKTPKGPPYSRASLVPTRTRPSRGGLEPEGRPFIGLDLLKEFARGAGRDL